MSEKTRLATKTTTANKFMRIEQFKRNKRAHCEKIRDTDNENNNDDDLAKNTDLNNNSFKSPKKRTFDDMSTEDLASAANAVDSPSRSTPTKLLKSTPGKLCQQSFGRIKAWIGNTNEAKADRKQQSACENMELEPQPSSQKTRSLSVRDCPCDEEWMTSNNDGEPIKTQSSSTWSSPYKRIGLRSLDSSLVNYMNKKKDDWKQYSDLLVDTHCHFDMLFNK
jgi:hypothetical protein